MSSDPRNIHGDSTSPTGDTDTLPPPPSSINQDPLDRKENYDLVLRYANATVLSMKAAARSKFTIAKQSINPQIAPALLHIKENAIILPHDSLLALSRISELFETLHSEFGTYRCQLDNQETRNSMQSMTLDAKKAKTEEVVQVLRQNRNAFFAGGNEILDQHQSKISKTLSLVQDAKNNIEEELRLIHKLKTDIQYQQGLLEALGPDIDKDLPEFIEKAGSPSASAACIQVLIELIKWVTNLVMTGLTYHISFKQDQLSEVLRMCTSTLESQFTLLVNTEEEIKKHKSSLAGARDMLRNLDTRMWMSSMQAIELALDSDTEKILNIAIKETEEISLTQTLALRPIRRYQALLGAGTGPGIHIKRDVELFCDVVPTVLEDLKLLCSAKAIIKSDDQVDFETNLYALGRVIFRRLERFKNLYYRSEVADPNAQEMFLKRETFDFARETSILIHAIDNTLRTRISTRKGKRLSKKRDNGDRCHGHFNWDGRPMTTSTEGLGTLQRVELAVEFIHNLSISSCAGMFLRSTGTRETRMGGSAFEFNLANASLSDFWDVMRRVVEPGLEFFNNATVEKPKSRFAFPKFD